MNSDFLFRATLSVAMIVGGFFLYWRVNQRLLLKAKNNIYSLLVDVPDKPVIVYFTTPDCAPCKTLQKPALNEIMFRMGDNLKVVEIDATEKPELAKQWGVMSVPTTFLLNARGEARYVNNGVARAEKLLSQLQRL